MLKFWRNAGKGKVQTKSPEHTGDQISPRRSSSATGYIDDFFARFDVDDSKDDENETYDESSRLSKSLEDILSDKGSLAYFVPFMDTVSASTLVDFWFDVERFKASIRSMDTKQSDDAVIDRLDEQQHQPINRTISFDSSLPLKKRNCLPQHMNHLITSVSDVDSKKFSSCHSNMNRLDSQHALNGFGESKNTILNDAICIFKKYIALESPCKLDLPETVRTSIISAICHPEGVIDLDIFKHAQDNIFEQMNVQYFERFIQSDYHCKYQLDILTSGSLTIEDIIYNQMALVYFMEYLEQEQCNILLEFTMAVMNFKEHLATNSNLCAEQAQNDAIVLYEKYFSLQATNSLGFSSEIRYLIEENICKDGGPSPDCFHKPFRLVIRALKQYIATFLTSQVYYKYLSEMISSIQGSHWQKRKKSASDCSSEVSARNTLQSSSRVNGESSSSSMRIDLKQLYNGDLLWRRKSDKGLCLGRVNSLGRFESSMEPDPEKRDASIIKRVVNKFVSGEKDRAEEEMAWQVAHMIVKDVTDVTMGIPPDGQL